MANVSQSSVQAAIAAIVEQQQRDGNVPPEYISQTNRRWIHQNLNKRLEPVFAEVARKIGFDKDQISEIVARQEQEVRQYLKQREAETEKNFAARAKKYRGALANRKAALDEVTVKPTGIKPPTIPPPVLLVLDKPVSIFGQPSGLLADENIESGNSWAKVVWSADKIEYVRLSFFFSWLNDSDKSVIITGANSSLTARGKCSLHVDPGFGYFDWADLWLWSDFKIYLGSTEIDGEGNWIAELKAYATANIFGGTAHTDTHDVFKAASASCLQEVLVGGRQLVIFAVEFWGLCSTLDGNIKLEFDKDPFVHCPGVTVALLEPLVSFSETLSAEDANWQGYCLVQRIEPVRLSRSGTQVELTLRAGSVGTSIDRIYISQADPAGQPFDSAGDLTVIISAPIVLAPNTAFTLGVVKYRFDETKPLLIAFDFSAAPASAIKYAPAPPEEASAYYKLGAAAETANRAGFTAYPGLYLIERIEVS